MESSGSSSEMPKSSMSEQLESMRIDADTVQPFREMSEKLALWSFREGAVSPALARFFQRVTGPDMYSGLAKLESAPADTESIMTLYWEWSKAFNKPMLETLRRWMLAMKIQSEHSILNNGRRLFIWVKQKRPRYMGRVEGGKVVEVWEGRVSASHPDVEHTQFDGNLSEMQIARCTTNVPRIEFFHFTVRMNHHGFLSGWRTKREDAAEDLYRYWYEKMTNTKFQQAEHLTASKKVVVLGKWVRADVYQPAKHTIIPDAIEDIRTWDIFVTGGNGQEKAFLDVVKVTRNSRNERDKLGMTLEFPSGVKLTSSLDWYVYKPEQYVTGEVYCKQCGNIFASPIEMDMRFVQGLGPRCGPCRDYLEENGALDSSSYD